MNLNQTKKYLAILAVAMLLVLPVMVWAQLPPIRVPVVPGTDLVEIENTIRRVARFFLAIGVVLALIFIIYGGILWMSAGSDATKITNATTRMKQGVWGALIIIAVALILQTLVGVVTRVFFR